MTADTTVAVDLADIEIHPKVQLPMLGRLWEMYADAFEDINRQAVQRHMMTYEEFVDVMLDDRVSKYIATTPDGAVLGLSLLTNQLRAWPLISVEYFEAHWPVHYRENRIWYVGFVATVPAAKSQNLFPRIIAAMYQPVIGSNGVAVMDFCAVNVDSRNLPKATTLILRRLNGQTVGELLDRQEFHLWNFDPSAPR